MPLAMSLYLLPAHTLQLTVQLPHRRLPQMCDVGAFFNLKQQNAMTQAAEDAATSLREHGWAVIQGESA